MKDFLSGQRLLVLAPHSDDEVIGSGGLIAKIKDLGGEVFVQVFTVGDLNHYDGREHDVGAETRLSELEDTMKFLDIDGYEVLFKDNHKHLRLDQTPRRDLVSLIERDATLSVDKVSPTIIVIPAPSYNQDHEAVYRAGITACRPHLSNLKSFQHLVLVSDAPQLCWNDKAFIPNFYVDITDYLPRKLQAFKCHKSQQRPDPHNGGLESVRLLALTRGREISVEAAEAYRCLRFVT